MPKHSDVLGVNGYIVIPLEITRNEFLTFCIWTFYLHCLQNDMSMIHNVNIVTMNSKSFNNTTYKNIYILITVYIEY